MGKYFSLSGDIRYRYLVEPAFVKDLHQRFDIYSFSAGLGTSALKGVGLGMNIGMQVTFSRLFENKTDALKSKIYFINRIPWEHQDVAEQLDTGDAVRIEINSDGSIGKGTEEAAGNFKANLGASVSRGTRFIVDTYKLKGNNVRLRLIATRTEGMLSVSAAISPLEKLSVGSGLGDKILGKFLKCHPVSAGASTTLGERLPVDTFMVDYVFNLDNKDAQLAYNQIMSTIKHLHFERHLNFQKNEQKLGEELLKYVQPAEHVFTQDKHKPRNQVGVDRIFKGKTVTELGSFSLKSECLNAWDAQLTTSNSDTNLRSYNRDEVATDQILLTTTTLKKKDYVFGLYGNQNINSMNGLFNASRDESNLDRLRPTNVTDIIFTQDIQDKDLSTSDVRTIKDQLELAAPTIASTIDWGKLTEGSTKSNGYVRTAFVFHHEAFKELQKYDAATLYTKLRNYVDNYPDKLSLPANTQHDPTNTTNDKYEADIQDITYKLNRIFHSESHQERLDGFSELRRQLLFQAIGPGFITSLLPTEKLEDLVYFRLNAGAAKGSSVSFIYGKNDISDIYKSMQYIQAVINDRSFDLRLQLDEKGEFQIYKLRNNGQLDCKNCDQTPSASSAGVK